MKKSTKPNQETLNSWHDDPSNWKMGVFYFNKLDKRLFPPKRIQGMGWTVNFANPFSILALIVIIAGITLFIKYLKWKSLEKKIGAQDAPGSLIVRFQLLKQYLLHWDQFLYPVRPELHDFQGLSLPVCKVLINRCFFFREDWNSRVKLKAVPFGFDLVVIGKLPEGSFVIPFTDLAKRTHYIAPHFHLHFWCRGHHQIFLVKWDHSICFLIS